MCKKLLIPSLLKTLPNLIKMEQLNISLTSSDKAFYKTAFRLLFSLFLETSAKTAVQTMVVILHLCRKKRYGIQ